MKAKNKRLQVSPYPILFNPAPLLVFSKSDSQLWQHIKINTKKTNMGYMRNITNICYNTDELLKHYTM